MLKSACRVATCGFFVLLGMIASTASPALFAAERLADQEASPTKLIDWNNTENQVWLGKELWANPMEDWNVRNRRMESINGARNRNVHILTHTISHKPGSFETAVNIGQITSRNQLGAAGFIIGIQDEIDDYRARCLKGKGIECGLQANGVLFLGSKREQLENPWERRFGVRLVLKGTATQTEGRLTLQAFDAGTKKPLGPALKLNVPAEKLYGNIALLQNPF